MSLTIGLIGEFNPAVRAHRRIPEALERVAGHGQKPAVRWLPTTELERDGIKRLGGCDGLWCVPGSPYASFAGALLAIRHARERNIPFLGTCGGFQHMLIEYARNVLGKMDADHTESNPGAASPLIHKLSCSLVGVKGTITFTPGSKIAAIYGAPTAVEEFHCNFGLNSEMRSWFDSGDLKITGNDETGEARVAELNGHRFFFGTLYQPELSAGTAGALHPLIEAFAKAAAGK
jgi:CTP synthase (UTP-ammonia lyase)